MSKIGNLSVTKWKVTCCSGGVQLDFGGRVLVTKTGLAIILVGVWAWLTVTRRRHHDGPGDDGNRRDGGQLMLDGPGDDGNARQLMLDGPGDDGTAGTVAS